MGPEHLLEDLGGLGLAPGDLLEVRVLAAQPARGCPSCIEARPNATVRGGFDQAPPTFDVGRDELVELLSFTD